ncbi:MAG: cadherin-like beta sandwich domain-containing protein [Deltaproteobacteria bacterium]|nr:cadherin-like beta sandwich domain-containing protein [Deltaproteobacteria bacterium]
MPSLAVATNFWMRVGGALAIALGLACTQCGDDSSSASTTSASTGSAGGAGGGVEVAPALSGLEISEGSLVPAFSPDVTSYAVEVPLTTTSLTVTATALADETLRIDGLDVGSGAATLIDLKPGANTIVVEVSGSGGMVAYTISVQRGLGVSSYLKADASQAGCECGSVVAVSGSTLVMGCYRDNVLVQGEGGAVFVFEREASGWKFAQKLVPAVHAPGDRFGMSVAIEGDVLVVGAPGRSSGTEMHGAAYVFERDAAGVWSELVQLKATGGGHLDQFGESVAVSGDRVAVGAPGEDGSATGVSGVVDELALGAGAAYVFVRSGAVYTQEAYIKAADTAALDLFGTDLALSADRLVVAAPGEDSAGAGVGVDGVGTGAIDSGAVYVYERSATGWALTSQIKGPSPSASDMFGAALSLRGDALLVGIPGDDATGAGVGTDASDAGSLDSGAAALYRVSSSGEWSLEAHFKSPAPSPFDGFGGAVAIEGPLALIGSPREDGSGAGVGSVVDEGSPSSGAAHTFRRFGGAWLDDAYVKAPVNVPGVRFGSALALGPDDVVAGLPYDPSDADGVDGDPSDASAPDAGGAFAMR